MNFDKSVYLLLVLFVVHSQQSVSIEEEVKNSTTFALDWYRSSFDGNTNTVVSPLSFRIILSLLYQSTIGNTEQELKEHLYFADKDETAASQRLSLDRLITNPSLKVVNRIYVNNGYELNKPFITKAQQYHSGVDQKDFSKSEQTANEINQFVEEQTNGLIKNLVSKHDLGDQLLLLNTLYFKANWANEFEETDVNKKNFHGIDGQDYNIDFMSKTRTYKFYNSSKLQAKTLELPYVTESNAKFWIILPNENSNINELKEKLNPNALKEISENLRDDYNLIYVPLMNIDNAIDGKVELKKLGIHSMFERAEVQALEGDSKLVVSGVLQKVKITVNTKGTEAAAATYIVLAGSGYTPKPFVADRPFIYMVLTADTNEPLFIGHFSKPI